MVHKPTRLQKVHLEQVHDLENCSSIYLLSSLKSLNLPSLQTVHAHQIALNSRTRRPGTDQICGPFQPDEVFGHKGKQKRHLSDLSTRDRETSCGGFNSLQDDKDIWIVFSGKE